jgi:hypothetical protein
VIRGNLDQADSAAARAAALAAFGPFFAVTLHDTGSPATAPWRPLAALGDPAVLAARAARTRAALAGSRPATAVPARVAVSVTHLGLAARLLSPALGLAVLRGVVPVLDLDEAWWQETPAGPLPLSLPVAALAGRPGTAAGPGAGIRDLAVALGGLLAGPVGRLTGAAAALSVSRQVLRGNVASAVHGAVTVIGAARPALAGRAADLGGAVLRCPALAGAGTLTAAGFRRHSCCLIYQAAAPGARALCADCILAPRP